MTLELQRKLVVEFIGMFIVCSPSAWRPTRPVPGRWRRSRFGSVLMVMVFAGGHVSGGHFDPAVSTAVFLRGRMAAYEFGTYVVAQFVAAVIAGLLVR